MSRGLFFEEFKEELQNIQSDYAPYLEEGAEIPDDTELQEIHEGISRLLNIAEQWWGDGNITPEKAEYVAQGLDFIGELAILILDDDITRFEIDVLATEMDDWVEYNKSWRVPSV